MFKGFKVKDEEVIFLLMWEIIVYCGYIKY